MNIRKRIRRNKLTASKFADELINEDVMYKAIELNLKINGEFKDASRVRVLLDGIDKAYSYCILNLKLLRFLEKLNYSKSKLGINETEIINILDDVEENINLVLKYAITQKHFYEESKITFEIAKNIVYHNELREHMKMPERKIKQLSSKYY